MTDELEDNQAFARALFGGAPPAPDAVPPEGELPTAPAPDDPEHDHNQLIAQLFRGQEPE